MNNLDTFLKLNTPNEKDAVIEDEIRRTGYMQVAGTLDDQPEAEITTSTDEINDPAELIKRMMETGPRKFKRRMKGAKESFGNTLMGRLKRAREDGKN